MGVWDRLEDARGPSEGPFGPIACAMTHTESRWRGVSLMGAAGMAMFTLVLLDSAASR
jgi:hypothetical protein